LARSARRVGRRAVGGAESASALPDAAAAATALALGRGVADEASLVYLLGLAGGYYTEDFGGADVRLLRDAVVFEWVGGEQGLRAIYGVDQHGELHPSLHGAAKVQLADGSVVLYGGGNPQQSSGVVSHLVPHPALRRARPDAEEVMQLLLNAQEAPESPLWSAVRHPDGSIGVLAPLTDGLPLVWSSVDARSGGSGRGGRGVGGGRCGPGRRHGLHACLRGAGVEEEMVIFGGRGDPEAPGCFNDVWCLSLSKDAREGMWRQVETQGGGPPPKVWYGATPTKDGNWVICGGSEWQFEETAALAADRGVVWILALQSFAWSSVVPAAGTPRPEVVLACSLVEVSGSVLVLGGCMPHLLGNVPATGRTFAHCPKWYASLSRPWRFHLASRRWSQASASADGVPEPGDTLLRSHTSAVALPVQAAPRQLPPDGTGPEAVLLFGGSRYFTGAYFHDLLALRLPLPSPGPEEEQEGCAWGAPGDGAEEVGAEVERVSISGPFGSGEGVLRRMRRRLSGQISGAVASGPSGLALPGPAPGGGRRGSAGRLRAMERDAVAAPPPD